MAKIFKVTVQAVYDKEADVWTVIESDVPGLVAEAETLPELEELILELIPVLLEMNEHHLSDDHLEDVPIELLANYSSTLKAQKCA